ncbi:MAG: hypothetical protein ACI3Y0_05825 [Prevotella sp.]
MLSFYGNFKWHFEKVERVGWQSDIQANGWQDRSERKVTQVKKSKTAGQMRQRMKW